MPIRLNEQQQQALDSAEAQPPQVVREIVEDERRQRDIRAVALRHAGRRVDEAHTAVRTSRAEV